MQGQLDPYPSINPTQEEAKQGCFSYPGKAMVFPRGGYRGHSLTNWPVLSTLACLSGAGGNNGEETMSGAELGGPSPGGLYLTLQHHQGG